MEHSERLLPWPTVRALTSISRTTAWRWVNDGTFPAPLKLPGNRVAWRQSDITAWIDALPPA